MPPSHSLAPDLASGDWLNCERLIGRFEEAWRSGPRPLLTDFLPARADLRTAVLLELVHVDLEYRLRAGEAGRVEDYLYLPELAADPRAVLELLRAEYRARRRSDTTVSLAEYRQRFPDHAGALLSLGATWPSVLGHPAPDEPAPRPSSRLGKFELLDVVGRGAFGIVYRARDTELQRIVAVKVPRQDSLTPEEAERFLREARSAAQLRHPHIVAVHEAGQAEGTCYLVSDFIHGTTLAERLRQGPIPFRQTAELLASVADALHFAHQQGVIHRDLKPSNVLLDEQGQAYLMDFGLARREAVDKTLTLDGQLLGTPAYMSPEQARGDAHRVDARSDVYSLGVLLYEMLTGELPFRGNVRMVLAQVENEEPRAPRRLNDRVPRDLETICLKAMRKEPGGRYATAGEFAQDLRRFLGGEPVRARPLGLIGKGWRWCRRRPALASLTAALLFVAAVGLGGILWQWHQTEEQRRQVKESFQEANRTLEEMIATALGDTPDLPIDRRAFLEKSLRYYQDFLDRRPSQATFAEEEAVAHMMVGHLHYMLGSDRDRALDGYTNAVAVWRDLVARRPDDANAARGLAHSLIALGTLQGKSGQVEEAERSFAEAPECLEQLWRGNPSATELTQLLGWTYLVRAGGFRALHDDVPAGGYLPRVIASARQAVALTDERDELELRVLRASACHFIGLALYATVPREAPAMLREAAVCWEEVVRRDPGHHVWPVQWRGYPWWEDVLGATPEEPVFHVPHGVGAAAASLADNYRALGRTLSRLGEHAEAERANARAIELYEQMHREHPRVSYFLERLAHTHQQLADVLTRRGQLDGACKEHERVVQYRRELGRLYPAAVVHRHALGRSCYCLGVLHDQRQLPEQAQQWYTEAALAFEPFVREPPRDNVILLEMARTYYRVGDRHRTQGRFEDARQAYEQSVVLRAELSRRLPDDRTHRLELAKFISSVAGMYDRLQRPEATAWYEHAAFLAEELHCENPRDNTALLHLGTWQHLVARLHAERGRADCAVSWYVAAVAHREELCRRQPDRLDRWSDLGGTWYRYAEALEMLSRWDEARSAYRQAVECRLKVWEKKPDDADNRSFLSERLADVSRLAHRQGQSAAVAAVAVQRKTLWPRDPAELVRAAGELAQAAALVGHGKAARSADEEAVRKKHKEQALSTLEEAIRNGYAKREQLGDDPALQILRDLPDFQKLVSGMATP